MGEEGAGHLGSSGMPVKLQRGPSGSLSGPTRGCDRVPGGQSRPKSEDQDKRQFLYWVKLGSDVQNPSSKSKTLFVRTRTYQHATHPHSPTQPAGPCLVPPYLEHKDPCVGNGQVNLGPFPIGSCVESDAIHFQLPGNLKHLEIRLSRCLAPATETACHCTEKNVSPRANVIDMIGKTRQNKTNQQRRL